MNDEIRVNQGFETTGRAADHQEKISTDVKTLSKNLTIVGIGASAGGLDALQRLLPGLPVKVGMAFVIVQHMAPKYHSVLPSLLAKYTAMSIETITDEMTVVPDTIYITPPNTHVTYFKDRLKLTSGPDISPKPSIDLFFKSLAEEKMARAVGIILSGTGSDGAHGIRAIKSNEGITMAQTGDSARFDGMPNAAISTGLVDLVLPPEKIGEGLQTALKYPHLIVKTPVDEHLNEIDTILAMVNKQVGIDFGEYKKSTVHRRISRRMAIHQIEDPGEYVTFIEDHGDEAAALSKDMLISVTGFFRDTRAFESLGSQLRRLFEKKKHGDTFRAWVPGCSTGEEAYSIAILIADMLGEAICNYRFQIFATDIDEGAVGLARKAFYPVAALEGMDARIVNAYFHHRDNGVSVKKVIRDMVVLARQDLIKDTNFMHLDLISCRNLMIYINAELQEKLLSLFHFSLNPGGLLFLGKSESIGKRSDLFKALNSKWKLFQRKESLPKGLPELMKGRQVSQITTIQTNIKKQQDTCVLQEGVFFDSLLGLIDCCAVLTDENANIQYIRGDVSAYFKFPEGNVKENFNAVEMARPELRFALQSMFHKAGKDDQSITSNTINFNNDRQGVRIKIGPTQGDGLDGQRLIVFTPVEPSQVVVRGKASLKDADQERIRELEQELAITREHLQDTIEELETSTEELQSLNEELQAANEELQATNEELETSNEELQASNEELNTVNDELRAKSDEAAELLDNLSISERRYRRLVDNMNEALMLCEIEYGSEKQPTDLVIQQVNKAFEALMTIKSRDLPLRAGAADLLELVSADLLAQFQGIANGGDPKRFELRLNALQKHLTLSVYNIGDDRLGMVCRDDTEGKNAEEALQESEAFLSKVLHTSVAGLYIYDVKRGANVFINRQYSELTGYSLDDIDSMGAPEFEALFHPDDRQRVAEHMQAVIQADDGEIREIEYRFRTGKGDWSWYRSYDAVFARDDDGSVRRFIGTFVDITEHKRIADDLAASERKYRELLETANSIIIRWDSQGIIRYINEYGLKFFGYTAEELIDRDVMTIVPQVEKSSGRDLDALVKNIAAHPDRHTYVPSENITKDGRTVWVAWSNKGIVDEAGEVVEILAIGNDITALKQTEERLGISLGEKEILLKEVHHRVKNNMQVISSLVDLQTDTLGDAVTREILRDVSHRVRSMAMVHEKLYQAADLSNLDFSDYVRTLVRFLWNAHAAQASTVKLNMDVAPVTLTVNKAIPCGLIINELISNALKHAFDGRDGGQIAVAIHITDENKILLSIKDNGIGLPSELDWRQANSLGLRLVKMLTKQLQGTVQVNRDIGTEFTIAFERSAS